MSVGEWGMYALDIKEEADRIFKKLAKKNPKQLMIIDKKIAEIREEPYGYKFLKKPLWKIIKSMSARPRKF